MNITESTDYLATAWVLLRGLAMTGYHWVDSYSFLNLVGERAELTSR